MVEVFKTNVKEEEQSKLLIEELLCHFPNSKINFDLDDCDKILRIEAEEIPPQAIIDLLNKKSYDAEILT